MTCHNTTEGDIHISHDHTITRSHDAVQRAALMLHHAHRQTSKPFNAGITTTNKSAFACLPQEKNGKDRRQCNSTMSARRHVGTRDRSIHQCDQHCEFATPQSRGWRRRGLIAKYMNGVSLNDAIAFRLGSALKECDATHNTWLFALSILIP